MISTRTAAFTVAAVVALGSLTACGDQMHGTVTEKEYKPAKQGWKTVPETRRECSTPPRPPGSSAPPARSCRTIQIGTKRVPHTTPACWQIELDGDRDVCVDRERFEGTDVGDTW